MLSAQNAARIHLTWRKRAASAIVRNWLALRYRVLSRRYGRLILEEIDGVPLVVLPQVFNPVLLRTGAFMARALAHLPFDGADGELSVLDMGTGSGVGAIFAARRGARVVAVDINPEAVRCARVNALLNHLEDKIDVRQGDLFAPVAGQRFHMVLFNPPFQADVLEPGGRAMLVLSSDGDCADLLAGLLMAGFSVEAVAQKDLINEVLTIYIVCR